METSKIVIGYFMYIPVALLLTYFVARTLFQNSTVFMLAIFKGQEAIAKATNTLFKVGFYLLNIGFALLILKIDANNFNETYQSLIEILSRKIGGFSIYLGIMLFLNLMLFFRGKRKSSANKTTTSMQN